MYRIPRIDCNPACPASLDEAFARTAREAIACNNWPADFPYAPQAGFRIFHTGADLLLRFDVAERCTAACTLDDNGPYGPTPALSFSSTPKGATPTTISNATASARCSSATGATARTPNMRQPRCCAPSADAQATRTHHYPRPKATTAGR